jgi:hypothetical protein
MKVAVHDANAIVPSSHRPGSMRQVIRKMSSYETLERMTTRDHLLPYLIWINRHAALGRHAKRLEIIESGYERAISGLFLS